MAKHRSALFRGRHFQDEIIVLCVRWYLLSYPDLEEIMAGRGLNVDHSTIARWVLRYAPVLNERLRRHIRRPHASWRVDETLHPRQRPVDLFIPSGGFGRGYYLFPALAEA
jgi:transposase-like protein